MNAHEIHNAETYFARYTVFISDGKLLRQFRWANGEQSNCLKRRSICITYNIVKPQLCAHSCRLILLNLARFPGHVASWRRCFGRERRQRNLHRDSSMKVHGGWSPGISREAHAVILFIHTTLRISRARTADRQSRFQVPTLILILCVPHFVHPHFVDPF